MASPPDRKEGNGERTPVRPPETPWYRKGLQITAGCAIVLAVVVSLPFFGLHCLQVALGKPFYRWNWPIVTQYEALEIGQSHHEVTEIFGREPDLTCEIGNSQVDCFLGNPYPGADTCFWVMTKEGDVRLDDLSSKYVCDSPKDLPYAYAGVQVLIGPEGKVEAYTHMGEEVAIHTADGDVSGDEFSKLDASFFGLNPSAEATGAASIE